MDLQDMAVDIRKSAASASNARNKIIRLVPELLVLIAIELLAFHLASERINARQFPQGDEGSWMMVASQVAHGQGFTTRWLEHPFLTPTVLPRPDDFRYPGLTLILAAAFSLFGISYATALWAVLGIFLVFLLVVYAASRAAFGRGAAILTMLVSAVSLLQLYWNTQVYTEGLFGIALGLVILWTCVFRNRQSPVFWIGLGIGCALIFYVRPNGILFFSGIPFLIIVRGKKIPWHHAVLSIAVAIAVISPWLYRNWHCFGNPLHIATNAGLLRGGDSDPLTLSFSQYLSRYGVLFPLQAMLHGLAGLFKALNFFEHGLLFVPLAGVALGFALRLPFFNAFVAAGFALSFLLCCYVSFNYSWAGARYLCSMLPFIYAYGIFAITNSLEKLLRNRAATVKYVVWAGLAVCLCAPVVFPHKYYERTLPHQKADRSVYSRYTAMMDSLLKPGQSYLATSSAAQFAFLSPYHCVSVHRFFDTSYVETVMKTFAPILLAGTQAELADAVIAPVLQKIERMGYSRRMAADIGYIQYFTLKKAPCP
jgi:hypothetical protein